MSDFACFKFFNKEKKKTEDVCVYNHVNVLYKRIERKKKEAVDDTIER